MIILTIRTDKPEAEVGLYDNEKQLAYEVWPAHRQLAESLHKKIQSLLSSQQKDWSGIDGVVIFKGPGSFTGLRIGLSVANALAYSRGVPIIGATGADWIESGISALLSGQGDKLASPEYGAEPHITTPKN